MAEIRSYLWAPAGLALAGVLIAGCAKPEQEIRQLYPVMAVFPEAVLFGDVVVPYTGRQQVVIQNAGQAILEVELELVDEREVFGVASWSHEVRPGESWPVEITLEAKSYLDFQGTLQIHTNDPSFEGEPLLIPLEGRGVDAPLPDISLSTLTMDFGEVPVGESQIAYLELKNQGRAPLSLGTVTQEGSGAFHLTTDPSRATVGPGDMLPVLITYAPTSPQGDHGALHFPSDDPDEPELSVLLLGNGGGDFEYPVATIDCPSTSAPPEWVPLDGSGSYDPGGSALTYAWSLVGHPIGSQAELSQYVTDGSQLYTDLAGTYEVQLVVTNAQGASSPPDRCVVEAVPADALHVELTWDTPNTDLDLHLLQEGAELFELPGDCNWCNPNPSWGAPGVDDDPRLDLDDRSDGPENINILSPADGAYPVKVHYFGGGQGAVTATVRVFIEGNEVWVGSRVMNRREVWDVGQVNWPDGTFGVESTPLWKTEVYGCF